MRRPVSLALVAACLALAAGCAGAHDRRADDRPRVDVFGPYLGREADAFAASLATFSRETGVRVAYTGSADFAGDLRQRTAGGVDAPDIALVPQPGLIAEMIRNGELTRLDPATSRSVGENYDLTRADLGGGAGSFVVPYRVSVKSIVWFRPDVFRDHGWTVPRTLDELGELAGAIDGTPGIAPWCFSLFSGSSSGWPGTDWVEDLLLRRSGRDAYERWTSGDLRFDSPEVRAAFDEFGRTVLGPSRIAGGLRAVLETPIPEAWEPLLDDQPGCALYKQASFAASWFPEGTAIGPQGDIDFFVLPGVRAGVAAPVVVAGDGAVQFNGRDEVDRLMTYLATPDGARAWAAEGGYISARTSVDPRTYYPEVDQRFAELLREDRAAPFDASDRMPPAIGSDLLWRQMTAWVSGAVSLDELVAVMDAARESG